MEKTASITGDTDVTKYLGFDHLEFTVGDAGSIMRLFKYSLGMKLVAESNWDSHNYCYCSYVLQSGDMKFIISSPYLSKIHGEEKEKHSQPNPVYSAERQSNFFQAHGNGVSAVGIKVENVREAYAAITARGATGVLEPVEVKAENGGGSVVFAEILVYDDQLDQILAHMPDVYEGVQFYNSSTVYRLIQYNEFKGAFLPGYKVVTDKENLDYGLYKVDHIVANVYRMDKVVNDMKRWFGFHTFAFFTPEEIRTKWTSLNSEVLASNHADILLPINEPAPGKKESQILKYLKAYNGPGIQHIAIKTRNIFETLGKMKQIPMGISLLGTPMSYYETDYINERIKRCSETDSKYSDFEALKAELLKYNILIDEDEHGILLQIFTYPLFDRPTIFIEIIQRLCYGDEIPGCGKFGQGNFKALFEALERYFEGNPASGGSSGNSDECDPKLPAC